MQREFGAELGLRRQRIGVGGGDQRRLSRVDGGEALAQGGHIGARAGRHRHIVRQHVHVQRHQLVQRGLRGGFLHADGGQAGA
jgi:hypothetical protein